jgi:hypothetical protein
MNRQLQYDFHVVYVTNTHICLPKLQIIMNLPISCSCRIVRTYQIKTEQYSKKVQLLLIYIIVEGTVCCVHSRQRSEFDLNLSLHLYIVCH